MILVLGTSACSSKRKSFKASAVHAQIDSIVGVKTEELSRQSMEDLDRRISIEVKAKADSIVNARYKTQHPDTTSQKK